MTDATAVSSRAPGVDRLAFGLGRAADVLLLVELAYFAHEFDVYPVPVAGVAAWALLAALSLANQLGTARRIRLPRLWPVIAPVVLAFVAAIDCAGAWGPGANEYDGPSPLAAIGCGAVLMTFATQWSRRRLVASVVVLGAILVVDVFLGVRAVDASLGPRILMVAIALVPPLVALRVVRAFRAMLEFQSDLSQAQAATSTLGYGLHESEQLRTLDLRAEQLLDAVGSGREPLPLPVKRAELASTIATQLRLLLVADRSRTWLHHAFADSAVVGSISSVDDPDGLAALLAPDQRDGLLTAIWLFAGDATRRAQAIRVRIRRGDDEATTTPRRLAVTIELTGVAKRRLDPAAWQAISRVGRCTERSTQQTVTIEVDCPLDIVAEH